MTKELRSFGKPIEFRAEDGKAPVVEGYAAVFNSPTDLGGFREVVLPGAFKDSLANGADVRLLLNHEGLPLARTKSGTLQVKEDAHGLFFRAELDPSDPDVAAIVPKLKRGDLDQCSFAFATVTDNWQMVDGVQLRQLVAVELYDTSLVTYPAYGDTSVALRSRDAAKAMDTNLDLLKLKIRLAAAE
jgi:HK97 family phage prohead protease